MQTMRVFTKVVLPDASLTAIFRQHNEKELFNEMDWDEQFGHAVTGHLAHRYRFIAVRKYYFCQHGTCFGRAGDRRRRLDSDGPVEKYLT
jgi:hypothetical protein